MLDGSKPQDLRERKAKAHREANDYDKTGSRKIVAAKLASPDHPHVGDAPASGASRVRGPAVPAAGPAKTVSVDTNKV